MNVNRLGSTGLHVSALGFGCGAVGGLLTRGDDATLLRAVARAVEVGITYFDTAQAYGNGASEANLGRVLAQLRLDVTVGSKVMLHGSDFDDIENAIVRAAELSLQRLQVPRLALYQLHNPIGPSRGPNGNWLTPQELPTVRRAFERLQAQDKVTHWGINGIGESDALHQAVRESGAATIQICYNLLNPSAGQAMSAEFVFQNYLGLIDAAAGTGMGVIAIRVLAGGALAGTAVRQPWAAPIVDPIATSSTLEADVALAQRYHMLVRGDWAVSLAEAAIRFALSKPGISTTLVGMSNLDQLEEAIAAAERGPLPDVALAAITDLAQSSAT